MNSESEGGRYSACGLRYRPHLVVPPSSEYLGICLWNIQETVEGHSPRNGWGHHFYEQAEPTPLLASLFTVLCGVNAFVAHCEVFPSSHGRINCLSVQ